MSVRILVEVLSDRMAKVVTFPDLTVRHGECGGSINIPSGMTLRPFCQGCLTNFSGLCCPTLLRVARKGEAEEVLGDDEEVLYRFVPYLPELSEEELLALITPDPDDDAASSG